MIESARKEHKIAEDFKNNLIEGKLVEVRKYLEERNKGAPELINSKTMVLMDATGSMGSLL